MLSSSIIAVNYSSVNLYFSFSCGVGLPSWWSFAKDSFTDMFFFMLIHVCRGSMCTAYTVFEGIIIRHDLHELTRKYN
jgi:hypothetical protein